MHNMQTFVFGEFLPIITDFYGTGCIIQLRSIKIKTVNNLPCCPGSGTTRYNRGGVLFFEPTEYLRGDPALHLQSQLKLPETRLLPSVRAWTKVLLFFYSSLKSCCQGRVMGFVGGGTNIAIATALPPIILCNVLWTSNSLWNFYMLFSMFVWVFSFWMWRITPASGVLLPLSSDYSA